MSLMWEKYILLSTVVSSLIATVDLMLQENSVYVRL